MRTTAHLLIFMLMIGFLSSCKWEGTDTGNPQKDPVEGMPGGFIEALAEYTKDHVCQLVEDCFGVSSAQSCEANILSAQGLASAYGFPAPHETLEEVTDANLNFNSDAAVACLDALDSLACDSPVILSAYDPADPENFADMHRLFEVSSFCSQVGVSAD